MSINSSRFYLYKRTNHIYYIGYHENGRLRWKSTGVTTKPEANKALTQFKNMMTEGRKEIVSVSAFVERFMTYSEANHAKKTARLFRSSLTRFSRLARGSYLREISPEHVDRYKTTRLREVSPVSVNVDLRMLKSAFGTARRWRLIESNPFEGIALADVPQKAPSFFTVQEFQRLVDCIGEGWLREVVLFAVLTGMRQGEILSLRWSDVDLPRRVVHIETNPSFKTKQGRRRTIPVNESALYLLSSKAGKSNSEHVFTLNDRPLSGGWGTHLFKRYVRKAGLKND
ncbi:MAG: site-specific integrase, partial [Bacteroidota bacterium]